MKLQQCMGGWCKKRGLCAHYIAPPTVGMPPEERLCATGIDEPERFLRRDYFIPIREEVPA